MIPTFRAKRRDTGQYIEGPFDQYAAGGVINHEIVHNDTLAIHFPDMVSKNGEKVFASLNENGAGGTIFRESDSSGHIDYVLIYTGNDFILRDIDPFEDGAIEYSFREFGKDFDVAGIYDPDIARV